MAMENSVVNLLLLVSVETLCQVFEKLTSNFLDVDLALDLLRKLVHDVLNQGLGFLLCLDIIRKLNGEEGLLRVADSISNLLEHVENGMELGWIRVREKLLIGTLECLRKVLDLL